jgi:hypothetical protein
VSQVLPSSWANPATARAPAKCLGLPVSKAMLIDFGVLMSSLSVHLVNSCHALFLWWATKIGPLIHHASLVG